MHLLLPVIIIVTFLAAIVGTLIFGTRFHSPESEGSSVIETIPSTLEVEAEPAPLTRPLTSTKPTNAHPTQAPVSENGEASVVLQPGVKIPNAFDFVINFDPKIVEVRDIKVGNVWTNSNTLNISTDNTNGVIKLAAGQGFGASQTNNSVLLTIKYKTESTYSGALFTVSKESKFGYSGQSGLTSVRASDVTIALSQ